jgi:hypothetical protein
MPRSVAARSFAAELNPRSPAAAGQGSTSGASAAPQIQVVLNWLEELKARVPTK